MAFALEVIIAVSFLLGIALGAMLAGCFRSAETNIAAGTKIRTQEIPPEVVWVTRGGSCFHLDSLCQTTAKAFTLCRHCQKKNAMKFLTKRNPE